MQHAKIVTRKDLIEKAFSLPYETKVEVYVKDDGRVEFSSSMEQSTYTRDPSKVGTIDALSFNDLPGFYSISKNEIEINTSTLGTSGKRAVQKGIFYKTVEILTFNQAIDLIDDIAKDENWDIEILALHILQVQAIRSWVSKHKGKHIEQLNEFKVNFTNTPSSTSQTIEDYADMLIETDGLIPSSLNR